jgi:hypothetical protein
MRAKWCCPLCIAIVLCACAPMDYSKRVDLLGDPAPVSAATRAVVITRATHSVNVTGGEIIRFVVGDKSFAWNFDGGAMVSAFELNLAAPPGVLDHKVMAYVAPDPRYSGDGGGGHGHGHGGGGRR